MQRYRILIVIAAVGVGLACNTAADPAAIRQSVEASPADSHALAVTDTSLARQLSATFRSAADRALPAVVYVRVEAAAPTQTQEWPFPFLIPREDMPAPQSVGTGSGFIIDRDGHIITNAHVAENATEVDVRLKDGREYSADVVGSDPATDVAVLKIDATPGEDLPVAQIDTADDVEVGDWVLALGNPLGLDFTVTAGIVSAKGRAIDLLSQQSHAPLEAYIQTDAAINPGNSGGPLVDLAGRVVGINSAIESPTGAYAGYGFAVPISLAAKVAGDLIQYGAVRRPRLGISVSDATAADANVFQLPEIGGAVVRSVQPNTPAEKGGLRMGDVITSVEGQPVHTASDLTTSLARHQPGDEVRLEGVRYGKPFQVTARLTQFDGESTADETARAAHNRPETVLGFSAEALSPDVAARLGVETGSQPVVTAVDPIGPAAEAGVRPGQTVVRLNGREIGDTAELKTVASRLHRGDVVSLVVRNRDGTEAILNYQTHG